MSPIVNILEPVKKTISIPWDTMIMNGTSERKYGNQDTPLFYTYKKTRTMILKVHTFWASEELARKME